MDLIIQQHQQILVQLRRQTLSVSRFRQFFDDFVLVLNANISNRVACYRLLTRCCFDFSAVHHLGLFNRPKIIQHPFFLLLSRTFEMLFTKLLNLWLSIEERECLDAISLFICSLCLHKNQVCMNFFIDNNKYLQVDKAKKFLRISYEKLFFTETFQSKFLSMLKNDLSENRTGADDDFKYQLANRCLRLWMKLNPTHYQYLLDGLVRCLKSEIYEETIEEVDPLQLFLSPKQRFFLYQCPKFLQSMFPKREEEITKLCEHLIGQSLMIFRQQLAIVDDGEFVSEEERKTKIIESRGANLQAISWYVELLNFFALEKSSREYFVTPRFRNRSSLHRHTTILEKMIEILQIPTLIDSVMSIDYFYHPRVSLVAYALILLYNLVFDEKIFHSLKEKKPFGILKSLVLAADKTIQFTATTLKAILEKEKLDDLEHPTQTARSYLYMIENTLDEVSHRFHGIVLDGVLTNLEMVVQNDFVKEEIVNDDGVRLLADCCYRADLDLKTIQYPALRIIDTLSFAEAAPKKLKENERLMDHLSDLVQSKYENQSEISRRVLWIAEHELKFIAEEDQREAERTRETTEEIVSKGEWTEKNAPYQYVRGDYRFRLDRRSVVKKSDVVISYHQSDEAIVQKIQEQLQSSRQYDVSALEAKSTDPDKMALIIGKAPLVLICYSQAYRDSNASRLQAAFAQSRDKHLIGLKVNRISLLTGWLKKLLLDTKTIDFTKNDLNYAMTELTDSMKELKNVK